MFKSKLLKSNLSAFSLKLLLDLVSLFLRSTFLKNLRSAINNVLSFLKPDRRLLLFEDYRYVVRRSGFVRVGTHVIQHEHRFDGESGRRAGANLAATLRRFFLFVFGQLVAQPQQGAEPRRRECRHHQRGVVQRGLLHHTRGPARGLLLPARTGRHFPQQGGVELLPPFQHHAGGRFPLRRRQRQRYSRRGCRPCDRGQLHARLLLRLLGQSLMEGLRHGGQFSGRLWQRDPEPRTPLPDEQFHEPEHDTGRVAALPLRRDEPSEPQADGQYRRLHLDFPRRGRLLPAPAEPLAGLHLPRQVDPQGRHLEAAHLRAGVEPLHVDRLFGLQSRSQQPRERRPASGRGLLFLSAGTHVQRRHQFQPLIDRNHEINILSFTGRRGPWDGFLQ